MIKLFSILSFSLILVSCSNSQVKHNIKWNLNYDEVTTFATKENKLILLFFHGSDWCPPCVKMQKEVFAADTFINTYAEKILFLDVDFPNKPKLSDAQLKHNNEVKKRFGLPDEFTQGYPQVVIINDKGEVLYQEKGYNGSGPAYLMEKISLLLKIDKKEPF